MGKFAATASCGYAKNLRHDMYYKIQDFSFAEIDRFSTSSLVTRLTTDVTNVQNAYQMIIRIAIRTPLMLIFAFVFSFRINWRIALIFLAAMPVLMLALALMMKFVMPFFRKIFRKYDDMNESVPSTLACQLPFWGMEVYSRPSRSQSMVPSMRVDLNFVSSKVEAFRTS